jgi:fructose-1-phosphate kinase PfkB-like protein
MLAVIFAVSSGEIFMVKPNLNELEKFSGLTINSTADIVKACTKYLDKGVLNVLVSLGADGAVFTNGTKSYYCKSASVAVNSTVGAGDSMVAATCVGLLKGVPMHELLKMAVAAGTASVTTSGTNLFYFDKYKEIYTKIYSQKI